MNNLYIDQRRNGNVTILDLKGRLRVGGNAVALHRSIRSLILEKNKQIILNLAGVSWKTVPETLQAQLGAHYLD